MKIELTGDGGIYCAFTEEGIQIRYSGVAVEVFGICDELRPYSDVKTIQRILGAIDIEWEDGSRFNIVPVGPMGKVRVEMNRAILYTKEQMENLK